MLLADGSWRVPERGRLINEELADRVGLSPSPCLRRMRRLEEAGVLTSYVALMDSAKVGLGDHHLRPGLARTPVHGAPRPLRAIGRRLARGLECYLMTGDVDYQLKIVARGLSPPRLTRAAGVAKIHSRLAFRPIVRRTLLAFLKSAPVHLIRYGFAKRAGAQTLSQAVDLLRRSDADVALGL